MDELENELGKVYVYVPEGAKLNFENKPAPAPEIEYEERQSNVVTPITKKLCGGAHGRSDD
jgi:hypothetical protein